MRAEAVGVGGVQARGGDGTGQAEVVLVLLDALDHVLERGVVNDVVHALDHRVILGAVVLQDRLVVDDAVPFGRVRQRVRVLADLVRVGLALVGELAVHLGVLQRLDVVLVLGELVVAGDVEHGRRVRLRQFGGHRRIVGAGGGGLDLDFHAGLFGIQVGDLLQLVNDLRLVVHVVDVALAVVRGVAAAAGESGQAECRDRGDCDGLLHGVHGFSFDSFWLLGWKVSQPFTAPAVTPAMMCFWQNR